MKAPLFSTKIIFMMIIPLFLFGLYLCVFYKAKKTPPFICDGILNIRKEDKTGNEVLSGAVKVTINFNQTSSGYVSEKGYIEVKDNKLNVDRYIEIKSKTVTGSDFFEIERIHLIKNTSDNIPESIYTELSSPQKILNLRFHELNKDAILISDLRRILIACNKR